MVNSLPLSLTTIFPLPVNSGGTRVPESELSATGAGVAIDHG
ncbi:hypothetical protein ABIA45_007368 [Bradyrhizobium sp. USDA 336]